MDKISFKLNAGDSLGIIGATGSGKVQLQIAYLDYLILTVAKYLLIILILKN